MIYALFQIVLCIILVLLTNKKLKLIRDPEINNFINGITERLYILILATCMTAFLNLVTLIYLAINNLVYCKQEGGNYCMMGFNENQFIPGYIAYDVTDFVCYIFTWLVML